MGIKWSSNIKMNINISLLQPFYFRVHLTNVDMIVRNSTKR